PVDAKARGAVHIGHDQLAQGPVAVLLAPHLGIGEEEALVTRESVDYRSRLALQREPVRLVGHVEPTQVADVLPESVGAVHIHPRQRLGAGPLMYEAASALGD